jgi:phage gp45-like
MDGKVEATVTGGRFFNNGARPPVVQSGQAAIVDSTGSYIKLNNDGTMTFGAPVGITSTTPLLKQVGNFEVDGTMLVTETITGQGGIAISGDNGTGNASSVDGNFDTTGTIKNNGHDIGSTHKHVNSGGSGLGGVPQ